MKKLLFVLLILLTWYLAAMYYLVSLMTLAVAELLLLIAMFVVSKYLKRHLRVGFSGTILVMYKRQRTSCPVLIRNTGRLPAGKVRLRFRTAWWEEEGEKSLFLYGNPAEKEAAASEVSADFRVSAVADIDIEAPWCGMLYVFVHRAQGFDYLSLFKTRIPAEGRLQAAVLPVGTRMNLRFSREFWNHPGYVEDARTVFGKGGGEIRQLREYLPGDSYRMIHWNQTARTDELWVKEQEPEQEPRVLLYLDFYPEKRRSPQELAAYFEVLFSLTAGLVREQLSVSVQWKERDGCSGGAAVNTLEDCRALLLKLYQNDIVLHGGADTAEEKTCGLCLNQDLELFSQGRKVFRFSVEHYEKELEQRVFVL